MLGGNQNIDACFSPLKSNQPIIFESNVQLRQPILKFRKKTKEMEVETRKRLYYVAGVPCSFWECLFPSSSLHLIISCQAMHWITHEN
jgi:hypothetical protein